MKKLLEAGTKLYICPTYSLLVYASAAEASSWAPWRRSVEGFVAPYDPVYILAGQVFCVIEKPLNEFDEHGFCQVHVIAGEVIGWINLEEELIIQELVA